jgi:hypothetical protein
MKGIKSPYPYFGGKSKVAAEVWRRFGDVDTYIEPFYGSGAVHLANPNWRTTVETVNDLDHYIANFWRAIQNAPDEVAYYADSPINETDLHSRHLWLVNEGRTRITLCEIDPDHYDAKVAGWWVWGISCWMIGGFCETRPAKGASKKNRDVDVAKRSLPHLGEGRGVHRTTLRIGDVEDIGSAAKIFPRNDGLYTYIRQLAERMADVRVCCGGWERVLKPAVTWAGGTQQKTCGVFLDPPYSKEADRDMRVYRLDNGDVAHDVREWCVQNGQNPNMRIALCGYEGEGHDGMVKLGWSVFEWKAHPGFNKSYDNAVRERIWFSPHCTEPMNSLFDFSQ